MKTNCLQYKPDDRRYDDIKPIYLHLILKVGALRIEQQRDAQNDNLFSSAIANLFSNNLHIVLCKQDVARGFRMTSGSSPRRPRFSAYPNLFIFQSSRRKKIIKLKILTIFFHGGWRKAFEIIEWKMLRLVDTPVAFNL